MKLILNTKRLSARCGYRLGRLGVTRPDRRYRSINGLGTLFDNSTPRVFCPIRAASTILNSVPLKMMYRDQRTLFWWDGAGWRPDGVWLIEMLLINAAGDLVSSKQVQETIRKIRSQLQFNLLTECRRLDRE